MARKCLRFSRSSQRLLRLSYFWASLLLLLLVQIFNLLLVTTNKTPVFAQAHESAPVIRNLSNDASQLIQQGKTFYEKEQFADAAEVWQQAAQSYRSQNDLLNLAKTLSFLSLTYQQLGQWEKANSDIALSLQILKDNQPQAKEYKLVLAQALNTQGNLQLAQGQAELALTTWQQATDTYAQAGYETGVTGSLINQAQALQSLGFYRRANKILLQVKQTLNNQPDSLLKAIGLRSLGNALRVVGDLEQSREVLEQSLTQAQKLKSPQEIAAALASLGNTAQVQQDKLSALEYYQQATAIATSPTMRVQSQVNQLNLLVEAQSWSEAQALWPKITLQLAQLPLSRTAIYTQINFTQSLARLNQISNQHAPSWQEIGQLLATAMRQAKSMKDARAEAYALGNLGRLYEQAGQLSSANDLTQQALNLAQSIRASDIVYRWQWQLGRILKTQGNVEEAIANYTSAVNTLQLLRRDLVTINSDMQFSFRESIEPVYRELVELRLQKKGTAQPSQEDLKQARQTIESLQLAELENFFRSACLEVKTEIDLIVDSKNSTTAVIYAIILEQNLEIVIKLPHQEELRHYTIPIAQNQIEGIVTSLQQDLRDVTRTARVKKQSQQLYEWLIRPAEVELANSGVKSLAFVLDGALRNIPMAVLYDEKQQKYLVEKYALSLTPGLQLIAPNPLKRPRLNVLTAGMNENRSLDGLEFTRLENVERELERIQFIASKSKKLFNQNFTETNLGKELKSASFSVVHLATHGNFSSNPEETFIVTWDRLLKAKDFDSLLRDRGNTKSSPIELLVLSACQTATGDKRAVLGLAGIAVRAGAHSTLATLWSIDDFSTTELMTQFYQELKTGVTKAEALRYAQLTMLKHEKRPYFWAPYILVGNWL